MVVSVVVVVLMLVISVCVVCRCRAVLVVRAGLVRSVGVVFLVIGSIVCGM